VIEVEGEVNPPRNGEVAAGTADGGGRASVAQVSTVGINANARLHHPSDGSPPLPGEDIDTTPLHFIPEPHPDATPIEVPIPGPQALASPAVRLRAKELGIDLTQIKPSESGRIRHSDLDAFLSYNRAYAPATAARLRRIWRHQNATFRISPMSMKLM
jgi:2-oxoisovalerate dehydrogenase E2 component (dihydrolipoyl transacylase)